MSRDNHHSRNSEVILCLSIKYLGKITLFSHLQLSSSDDLNLSKTKMIRFPIMTQSQVNYLTFSTLVKISVDAILIFLS